MSKLLNTFISAFARTDSLIDHGGGGGGCLCLTLNVLVAFKAAPASTQSTSSAPSLLCPGSMHIRRYMALVLSLSSKQVQLNLQLCAGQPRALPVLTRSPFCCRTTKIRTPCSLVVVTIRQESLCVSRSLSLSPFRSLIMSDLRVDP